MQIASLEYTSNLQSFEILLLQTMLCYLVASFTLCSFSLITQMHLNPFSLSVNALGILGQQDSRIFFFSVNSPHRVSDSVICSMPYGSYLETGQVQHGASVSQHSPPLTPLPGPLSDTHHMACPWQRCEFQGLQVPTFPQPASLPGPGQPAHSPASPESLLQPALHSCAPCSIPTATGEQGGGEG